MRAFLLIISLLYSFSVFAGDFTNQTYFKGAFGVHRINSIKENHTTFTDVIKHDGLLSPHLYVGFGKYLTNSFRVDLTYHVHLTHFDIANSNFKTIDHADNSVALGGATIKRKANIDTLMLNAYKDIFETNGYKVFIGVGLGVASIKEKVSFFMSGNIVKNDQVFTFPLNTTTQNSKKIYTLAYAITLGTSHKIKSNIHLDTVYSWHHFGRTKHNNLNSDIIIPKNTYKGHNISVGLRFDI